VPDTEGTVGHAMRRNATAQNDNTNAKRGKRQEERHEEMNERDGAKISALRRNTTALTKYDLIISLGVLNGFVSANRESRKKWGILPTGHRYCIGSSIRGVRAFQQVEHVTDTSERHEYRGPDGKTKQRK